MKRTKTKKIANVALNLAWIMGLIIIAAAVTMSVMHIKPAVVVSGSMEPVIHTGSLVFIDTDYKDVKERDIIAFEAGGSLVTHRVTEVLEDGYITKGDANDSPDPGILKKNMVRGRTVMWIPGIGYAIHFMGGGYI